MISGEHALESGSAARLWIALNGQRQIYEGFFRDGDLLWPGSASKSFSLPDRLHHLVSQDGLHFCKCRKQ